MIDATELKRAASGRWPEILSAVGGVPADALDGRNHPCPRCGGTDRFRMIDAAAGALYCNQCFCENNGDGLAAIMWLTGATFPEAIHKIGNYLGISSNGNGHAGNGKPKIVATYNYVDEHGTLLFQSVRFDPKDFRQRRPNPEGGWVWSVKSVRQVPYRLNELAATDPSSTIFVTEGEKDVDRLVNMGLVATCNAGGAEKWRACHTEALKGRRVAVLPDNDEAGRKHGQQVAASLHGKASSVKLVELPGLPPKGDVSDWLNAGHTADELVALVENAPEWKPSNSAATAARKIEPADVVENISNVTWEKDNDGNVVSIPLPMANVITNILNTTSDWPRRVGGSLFVDNGGVINWLDRPPALFGWLSRKCGIVEWHRKTGCASKEEVYAELQRTATIYEAIETMPHYPVIPDHYYTCKTPMPGDGSAIEKLLSFFAPDSELDRQLIRAMFATPAWGGPPGTRPAFLITCLRGRGRGKSTLAQHLARLYGGMIDFSTREDISIIKQRLLSPEADCKRVAVLDNLKTTRFSWAELEALITADVVNGKRMYVGDASRPNLLTWVLTLNGASLSTDMAGRVVEIRLGEPRYSDTWEDESRSFIEKNRPAILADVVAILQRDPKPMKRLTRWATWESQVLAKVDSPSECLDLIVNRREESDVEHEEGEILEDYFAQKLRGLGYDPERADVFIPNAVTAEWYNRATGDNRKTSGVTRTLKQLRDERTIWRLQPYRDGHNGERGFRWTGEHADISEPTFYDIRKRLEKRIEDNQREHGRDRGNGEW